ncbi:MAG: helix-turn-helix transcriptional regulator [Deltaproteobacteria bacterium]|nr:helix-turn-helix transcriptional regulator [Deltaproteobacteria bacterium]
MGRTRRSLFPDSRRQAVELGARLRLGRRRRGLSIAELAARVVASRPTISRLEHGNLSVSIAVLVRYLEVLGLASDIGRIAERDEAGAAIADQRLGRPRRPRSRGLADEL